MRIYITNLILISFLLFSNNRHDHKISVNFQNDNLKYDIKNNFSIYFISDGKCLNAKVSGNFISIPKLPENLEKVDVVFAYEEFKMTFKNVDKTRLLVNQEMNWSFKIVHKNFNEISTKLDSDKIKMIYVWEFNPIEYGEGINLLNIVYK